LDSKLKPTGPAEKLVPIVIDTREQLPYTFDPDRVSVTHRALPAGDYSLLGQETRVAIERKSLDDFVGSVIQGRERFLRELEALAELDLACVVVEASLEDILEHRYRSAAHPNAIFGSTVAIFADLHLPVFFCGDREASCRFVEGTLTRYLRKAVA
jgi:ERCC4-type nuclease